MELDPYEPSLATLTRRFVIQLARIRQQLGLGLQHSIGPRKPDLSEQEAHPLQDPDEQLED